MTSKAGTDVQSGPTTATSISVNHTLVSGSNRKVVAYVGRGNGSGSITGVTYGGVAMTAAATGVDDDNDIAAVYYLDNASLPADGVRACVASASNSDWVIAVAQYNDIAQGAPTSTDGDEVNPGTSITNTVAALGANDWAMSMLYSAFGLNSLANGQSQTTIIDWTVGCGGLVRAMEKRGGSGETSLSNSFDSWPAARAVAVWGTAAAAANRPFRALLGVGV